MSRQEKLLRVYDADIGLPVEYREPLFLAPKSGGAEEKIDVNEALFVNNFRKFSCAVMYCTDYGSAAMRNMIVNEYIAQTNLDEKLAKSYIEALNLPSKFRNLPLYTIDTAPLNEKTAVTSPYVLFWYQETPFGKALKKYWHGDADIPPNINIVDRFEVAAEDPDISLLLVE